jgi:hypothetical protein
VHPGRQFGGRQFAEVVHDFFVPGGQLEEAIGDGCFEAGCDVDLAAEDASGWGVVFSFAVCEG